MQKSLLCGTKSLYNSTPRKITPPLSKNYKDSTGQKAKKPHSMPITLYQIKHFTSRKIYVKMQFKIFSFIEYLSLQNKAPDSP